MKRRNTTGAVSRRVILTLAALAGLCAAIVPVGRGSASGPIWLAAQQATAAPFAHLHPALVTYRNHAYLLTTRETGLTTTAVYFTTNEPGAWATTLLSPHGPANAYESAFAALAIDASTKTLYAAWIYHKSATSDAVGVWTRDAVGTWHGPTDLVTVETVNGQRTLVGQVSVAAGHGHADVACAAAPSAIPGSCNDATSRGADVVVAAYDGHAWSKPQNLTSCVADPQAQTFADPRLALDEQGHASLISLGAAATSNLWFAESDGGAWSAPAQITHETTIGLFAGSPALRGLYALAASNGTVYVVFARPVGAQGRDVLLLTRPAAGTWGAHERVSPPDAQGCAKWGISIAAHAGRLAVAYIRGFDGYCRVVDVANAYNRPVVLVGPPGQLAPATLSLPATSSCGDTTLSRDGDLFRVAATCGLGTEKLAGDLYYAPEYLDVVGPTARLTAIPTAAAITLTWSVQDPTPGSDVAAYTLQVREDGGAWQTLMPATRATQCVFRPVQAGHRYAFRLRARDGANNWGAWTIAQTTIS